MRLSDLDAIPGAPLAYWMSSSLRRLFADLPALEGNAGAARQGLATGDDFRFVRAVWEVDPARIGTSVEADADEALGPVREGRRVQPVLGRCSSRCRLRARWGTRTCVGCLAFEHPVLLSPRPDMAAADCCGFSPRVLPAGCVFADKGPAIVAENPLALLHRLASRPAAALLAASQPAGDETSSGTASKSYEVGLVQRLPWPGVAGAVLDDVATLTAGIVERRWCEDERDETTRSFVAPYLPAGDGSLRATATGRWARRCRDAIASIADAAAIEQRFAEALELDDAAIAYLDAEIGPHPDSYPRDSLEDEQRFARWMELPIGRLVEELIAERGGSRAIATMTFVADRRLEVLAHACRRHPQVLCEAGERLGLLPPEEPRRTAEDLVSYLIGAALGRWDVRVGADPTSAAPRPDPFAATLLCPPAMLVGGDGLPAAAAPSAYPLALPPARLLVDEPGHEWDVEARLTRAAEALLADHATIVGEMLDSSGARRSARTCGGASSERISRVTRVAAARRRSTGR